MSILFRNAGIVRFVDGRCVSENNMDVLVRGSYIEKIGKNIPGEGVARALDCKGKVLVPGLYNAHTHLPMSILRSYADGLPLERWLNEAIFPAENKLESGICYQATLLACAEMLASGCVSASDMYFFSDAIARAVIDSGMKANISRATICFDDTYDIDSDERARETIEVYNKYNGAEDSRIVVDFAIHAVYTSGKSHMSAMAELARQYNTGLHIHLCETRTEVEQCKERFEGMTPVAVFDECGVFDVPCIAAHCVHLTDADREIMARKGVFALHCPTSNMKLASGMANVPAMLNAGVRVALGADGCASNNNLDMLEEAHIAALTAKGVTLDPTALDASDVLYMATMTGAASQRRADCGNIEQGMRADLVMLDFDKPHLTPNYNTINNLVYSAKSADVVMTMVDGRVLYENGQFTTIDIERVKHECNAIASCVFAR